MLSLLALRAFARVRDRLGGVGTDRWNGARMAAERAMGDGPDRTPMQWCRKWPEPSWLAFVESHRSDLLNQEDVDPMGPGPAEVTEIALGHVTNSGVRFGVQRGPSPDEGGLRVVGVTAPPNSDGWPPEIAHLLLQWRQTSAQVWCEIPGEPSAWRALSEIHPVWMHRLGVSLWLHPPQEASDWSAYAAMLEEQVSFFARDERWEQWVWPLCDLVQQCLEDVLTHGRPIHRKVLPWRSTPVGRSADWSKVRERVWDALEKTLGGAGAPEEILVACVLAQNGLLDVPP